MKIAILDDYQDAVRTLDCFSLLKDHEVIVLNETYADPADLAPLIEDCEALVLIRERTIINDTLLSRLPKLKLISQTGKISNHLNLASCSKHQVLVTEGKGSPVAPAELCWSLIMASSRHIFNYAHQMKNGQWQDSEGLGLGQCLKGKTLGIWGYGKIGHLVAGFGKAFGMNILIWGSDSSREKAVQDGFRAAESKPAFFIESDILSLHLRLNDKTRNCVTSSDLALMKKTAIFVNTSRAELVSPGALYQSLTKDRPGFAAVDVYEHEPASPDNCPLLKLPNVLCTPHLGYVEKYGYELYFRLAFENVLQYANGKYENAANPEIIS